MTKCRSYIIPIVGIYSAYTPLGIDASEFTLRIKTTDVAKKLFQNKVVRLSSDQIREIVIRRADHDASYSGFTDLRCTLLMLSASDSLSIDEVRDNVLIFTSYE